MPEELLAPPLLMVELPPMLPVPPLPVVLLGSVSFGVTKPPSLSKPQAAASRIDPTLIRAKAFFTGASLARTAARVTG